MDYSKKTKTELIQICQERCIKGYSGKRKKDILKLIEGALRCEGTQQEIVHECIESDTNEVIIPTNPITSESLKPRRTRDDCGKNEQQDIHKIVIGINNKTMCGIKIIEQFKKRFGRTIVSARERSGENRKTHYDFEVRFEDEPEKWYSVEHKGHQNFIPIRPEQSPWKAGVQFHNGSCDKYEIGKKYAKEYYNEWIGSGSLKKEWNIEAAIPSFEEWFQKDAKVQGNPGTAFGKELKRKVRESRGTKESLRETRQPVNDKFNMSDKEITVFQNEILASLNSVLKEKDYWLTIHGDLDNDFYCEWYPQFTLNEIKNITIKKELDIWFIIDCGEIQFSAILRWGKGVGFSNIRIDARD